MSDSYRDQANYERFHDVESKDPKVKKKADDMGAEGKFSRTRAGWRYGNQRKYRAGIKVKGRKTDRAKGKARLIKRIKTSFKI